MTKSRRYVFVGIGGSGMMPLALILKGQGYSVVGTDRSYDQGKTAEKFAFLKAQGIELFAQDGSAVQGQDDVLVISTAVEDTIPDVIAAKEQNTQILKRADLLAEIFNQSKIRIAVAGTSGKTTTTGMIAHLLDQAGLDPTVMNGGVMKNFITLDNPYASALVGTSDIFVTEADESDGSIALYNPTIAVLNNIALDHKPMEELIPLFRNFLDKAEYCILNFDCENVQHLAKHIADEKIISYKLQDEEYLNLNVPGAHNQSNAHAAIGVAKALKLDLNKARESLEHFAGIKRRMDHVGTENDMTVIDDFAHNPDKIAASLRTLKEQDGRLIIFFQPHGYGFLKLLGHDLADCFSEFLEEQDHLILVEPYYAGGTVDRSVQMKDIVPNIKGVETYLAQDRNAVKTRILKMAHPHDRIVIMGARDDSLSEFAKEILESVSSSKL